MAHFVIYPNADGGVALVLPTGELPIEVVARKDVPQGVPYKMIEAAVVPADREFRGAWEADFSQPDGYGDPDGYWAEQKGA